MPRTKNPPKPTWTSLIEHELNSTDDFMNVVELMAKTGANFNQATAALHHLKKRKAIDSVESNGRLYWFATPSSDTRVRTVEQRRPEDPGTRKTRRSRHGLQN